MAKKRSIVSYDKLTAEQKKELLKSFPDGYRSFVTQIKTPAGESLEALIWETEEVIYLVKISNTMTNALNLDDDDDEDDDLDDIIKPDDIEEEEDDEPVSKSKKSSDYDDEDEEEDDDEE
jgi:hypothetical protein